VGHTRYTTLVGVLATTLAAAPSEATVLTPVSERELVKNADLVFEGVVVARQYKLSSSQTGGDAVLPHTFVTFRIERLFKGRVTGSNAAVTLRMLGGLDPRGRFLTVDECPLFDIGEHGIVFVRRNQRSACPFVGWSQGRYRLIGGSQVYDDDGREVWLGSQLSLLPGPAREIDEALTHWRTSTTFTRLVHGGGGSEAPSTKPAKSPPGTKLTASGFRSVIASLVAALHTPAELASLPPVPSADPAQPFYVKQPRPVRSEPDTVSTGGGSVRRSGGRP
jgi:hypothetical protein